MIQQEPIASGATVSCDVVVVGSGGGALVGALAAAARGLDTVVVEKCDRLGGTSAYSGAALWLPGSEVQRRAGIEDSVDQAHQYLSHVLGDLGPRDRSCMEAFLATAADLVAFLEQHDHLAFDHQPFPDYFDAPGRQAVGRSIVPRPLPLGELGPLAEAVRRPIDRDRADDVHADPLIGGRALIGRLALALQTTGRVRVWTGTAMLELERERERVTGIRVAAAAGTARILTRHGVLLAAGGFERNADMRREHGTPGRASWSLAPDGNVGDAIRAAVAIGAGTDLMDEAWLCPVLERPDGATSFFLGMHGGIVVDRRGRRYANESLPYDRMGRRMAAAPDDRVPSHVIFDGRFRTPPGIAVPVVDPDACRRAGLWAQAETVADLAAQIGLDPPALSETVELWNEAARQGSDTAQGRGEDAFDRFFGRRGDGPNPSLIPIDRPPYKAARLLLGDLGTKGGLVTDEEARVLDVSGRPIAGLFATSNTVASFTRGVYPGPGIPLGTSMVGAYRAVAAMVARTADASSG